MATFLKIIRDCLVFVGPVILDLIIDYTKLDKPPLLLGIFYCILLFISTTIQTIINQQYFDRIFSVGTKMRSIFMNLIYKKSLVLSNDSRKESTVGQMINIIAVNAQYFNEFAHHVTNMWSTLLIILTTMYFLWLKLGM
jgi:ATP-binding cassette subfamily C (CFTR/MRP) protein 1